MTSGKVMLVEGVADQNFFKQFLRGMGVSVDVMITAPQDHGDAFNNKGGVFNTLPLLIRQLNDSRLSHVAVVVDADHASNDGMGFSRTLDKMTLLLEKDGYTKRQRIGEGGGFKFDHNDGLNSIGLWIMPDNSSDGGLEEMALVSAKDTEAGALAYAENLLNSVPGGVRYVLTRQAKAKAAAWMSWQAVPGQGLQQALRDNLIAMDKPLPRRLAAWISNIYA